MAANRYKQAKYVFMPKRDTMPCQGQNRWKGVAVGCETANETMVQTIKGVFKMKPLKEVECGQTVKVLKISGSGAVKRRIMDMGITKGTDIYVRKVAPLGDPMELKVRGYELSLRKADAEMILVQ